MPVRAAVSRDGPHLELARLSDGRMELELERWEPAVRSKGYCPAYYYGIHLAGRTERIGEVRLRAGDLGRYPSLLFSGHIGYGIEEAFRGHGYAAQACRLLAPLARAEGLPRLVITCQPTNIASRRTIEDLGGVFEGVFDIPADHEMYKDGRRQVLRFVWSVPSRGRGCGPRRAVRARRASGRPRGASARGASDRRSKVEIIPPAARRHGRP